MTHIWASKLAIIGTNNALVPDGRQDISWADSGILLIQNFGTNFNEISIEIHILIFKQWFENVVCAMALILSWPQYVKLTFTFISNLGHDYGYILRCDVYQLSNLR